jgi:hypothetical protein
MSLLYVDGFGVMGGGVGQKIKTLFISILIWMKH